MTLADTARLAVELNLGGNFERNLGAAGNRLDTFNRNVSTTARKVGQDLGHGLRTAGQNIERLAFAGAALAVGGGAAAVKWAGDFEAGMRTINSVALATPDVLSKAGEGLRTTFRETGQSMEDLQAAEYDLVSAGIKLKDAQSGVNTAVHLGIGALGSTSEAVDVLTTAINSYNLKAADGTVKTGAFARVADELAQAVADGKVKLSEIAASYAQVAPVAAAAGVKTGEIAAALGFLTAKGVPAAEVMTQMNRALVELQKPGPALQKVFDSLHSNGLRLIKKEGLAGALETIRERAAKLNIPFIELFGRQEAYKFALQTTGPNAAGFAAELDRIAHSAGMTNKQFDERAQGFNYQLGVLKANVQDAGITIGTALLPKLTEMATRVADFLRGHQDEIKNFGTDLARGFEEAADWAETIDWSAIGGALKGLVGFGKGLAEAFMSMPAEAKQLLLGLYGLNKLSGGAVVNIGVDLFKGTAGGLFQQFLGRGSPANPMFVVPIGSLGGGGGVPGVPAAAAGGGGVLSNLAAGALPITVAAIAPLALVGLTQAILGGPEKVAANDLAGRQGTAAARGLDPSRVPPTRSGPRDPFAEWVRRKSPVTMSDLSPDARQERNDAAVTQRKLDEAKAAQSRARDSIESMRIAIASRQAATTSKVGDLQRTTASGSASIVRAIRANRPIVNLGVYVSGDTARVTKNYNSKGTVSGGGHRTGGQQEYDY